MNREFDPALTDINQVDAEYFEYSKAANPISANLISRIPYHSFPASLYDSGPSRVVPLDLSDALGCEDPATGPGLCANFMRLNRGDTLTLQPNATSQVFYVIAGEGSVVQGSMRFNGPRAALSPCRDYSKCTSGPARMHVFTMCTMSRCCVTWGDTPRRSLCADPVPSSTGQREVA